jgi:hypothetical protein
MPAGFGSKRPNDFRRLGKKRAVSAAAGICWQHGVSGTSQQNVS